MIRQFAVRSVLFSFCLGAALLPLLRAADREQSPADNPAAVISDGLRLTPGSYDGRIAFATASLLDQLHYSRSRFDDSVSSDFLDRYIESLDPQRMHFLQSDLAKFEDYRTKLDDLTLGPRGLANTLPAYEIFSTFVERLEQRAAYAQDLLRQEPFEFNTDERVMVNRKDMPNPANLEEAKELWNRRLRFEYLQERLTQEAERRRKAETSSTGSQTNGISAATPENTTPSDSDSTTTASPTAAPKTDHEKIVETLSGRYHRTLKLFTDWDNEDVLAAYLSALAHVYDPHSDYMNRAQLDSFAISMNLQLFGIGAELRTIDGYCRIERLLPGGPAEKSRQIKPGDRIVAVAQGDEDPVDIVDKSLTKAVQLIRGPKGTEVRLTFIPSGEDSSIKKTISLVRDEISLDDQAAKGQVIEMPGEKGLPLRLGYIDLPSFYASMDLGRSRSGNENESRGRSTSADVAKLLNKFQQEGVRGVILDLRRNGGGSLEEAIKLTGLFIKEGPIVQVRNYDNSIQVDRDRDPSVAYAGPLIVLTSRFSASASEILAAALQDYNRALVVGDASTHGKGTVQTVQELRNLRAFRDVTGNEAGALKVTIRTFYRANGASTQKHGVIPDIVLPSVLNHSEDIGEAALDHALECEPIRPASYEKMNMVTPYLAELLNLSAQRIAANQDFIYVREDIELFRKQQEDKTISLNEKQRLQEMDETEARLNARKEERKARQEPNETIYEITLKQADLPGLPPPLVKTNAIAKAATPEPDVELITTNEAASAAVPADDDPDLEEPLEHPLALEGTPDETIDFVLAEAKHILVDYLSLMNRSEAVAVSRDIISR